MRVLVCGGRDYNDCIRVGLQLRMLKATQVIEGGATGADYCAAHWAAKAGIPVETYPADWKTHGKAAGPIRNQRMIDEGKPEVVIAFPGGRGTADMVKRAHRAGIKVIEVPS